MLILQAYTTPDYSGIDNATKYYNVYSYNKIMLHIDRLTLYLPITNNYIYAKLKLYDAEQVHI